MTLAFMQGYIFSKISPGGGEQKNRLEGKRKKEERTKEKDERKGGKGKRRVGKRGKMQKSSPSLHIFFPYRAKLP